MVKTDEGKNEMKFEYTITKEGGEKETMQAMSWKKLFKSLLLMEKKKNEN